MVKPNFRKMYNRFKKRKGRKKKTKSKSNAALTKTVMSMKRNLTALNKKSEPLRIYSINNLTPVYMNAEDPVKIYRLVQNNRFTSKAVASAPDGGVIPQDAYRKGSELYVSKIDLFLQLINRQSIYKTRLMVIQFKDYRTINRQIDASQGLTDYPANILMNSNFAKWGIVGSQPAEDVSTNPPYGRFVNYAGLSMRQPVKDLKDRNDGFYVLHDEVISNREQDNIPGQRIENETDCIKRSIYPKIKCLNFAHPYDTSPVNDIIAIVFNSYPLYGKWQDPDTQVVGNRGHTLNWIYNVYDN